MARTIKGLQSEVAKLKTELLRLSTPPRRCAWCRVPSSSITALGVTFKPSVLDPLGGDSKWACCQDHATKYALRTSEQCPVTSIDAVLERNGWPCGQAIGHDGLCTFVPPTPAPPPPMLRSEVLGFAPEPFKVGERRNVTTRTQVLFKPRRIVVPKSLGRFYQIHDIRIGGASQLVNANPIPATAFSEDAEDSIVSLHSAQPGTDVVFDVSCTHARRLLVVEYDLDTMRATRPAVIREEVPNFSAILFGTSAS